MNKRMQLYNRLHKLNTAQIITLGFAGVIILGWNNWSPWKWHSII